MRQIGATARERLSGYLFISPWLIGFIAFYAGPMLFSFAVSFTNWDFFKNMTFVGLRNYFRIFEPRGGRALGPEKDADLRRAGGAAAAGLLTGHRPASDREAAGGQRGPVPRVPARGDFGPGGRLDLALHVQHADGDLQLLALLLQCQADPLDRRSPYCAFLHHRHGPVGRGPADDPVPGRPPGRADGLLRGGRGGRGQQGSKVLLTSLFP